MTSSINAFVNITIIFIIIIIVIIVFINIIVNMIIQIFLIVNSRYHACSYNNSRFLQERITINRHYKYVLVSLIPAIY